MQGQHLIADRMEHSLDLMVAAFIDRHSGFAVSQLLKFGGGGPLAISSLAVWRLKRFSAINTNENYCY